MRCSSWIKFAVIGLFASAVCLSACSGQAENAIIEAETKNGELAAVGIEENNKQEVAAFEEVNTGAYQNEGIITVGEYCTTTEDVRKAIIQKVSQGYEKVYISTGTGDSILIADEQMSSMIPGILQAETSVFKEYTNATDFEIKITACDYFKYYYAYKTGDSSYLNVEDLKIYEKLKVICDEAKKCGSDYEKELYAHDYLVLNTKYVKESESMNIYSAKGAFLDGSCSCGGYSEAFDMIMHMLDIESQVVTGKAGDVPHSWNRVKIDGNWYNVDVTFDDPLPDEEGRLYRYYFNMTDEQILSDHEFDTSLYEAAVSTEYNYILNNYTVCKTQDEFTKELKKRLDNKETDINIIFDGEEALDPFKNIKSFNYDIDSAKCSYIYIADMYDVSFTVTYLGE